MKKRHIITCILVLIISFGIFTPTAKAFRPPPGPPSGDPGTVTIDKPDSYSDNYFLDSVRIKFTVTRNPGWFYSNSQIYIDGVKVDTTSLFEYDETFSLDLYVGFHYVRVDASYVDWYLNVEHVNEYSYFYIIGANDNAGKTDTDDLNDLRITELQRLGLGGQGVTICVIDSLMGYYEGSPTTDYEEAFGLPNMYKETNTKLRDISYYKTDYNLIEMEYYISAAYDDNSYPNIQTRWERLTFDNFRPVDGPTIHGSGVMSTLTQVAPHAEYIYIETELITSKIFALEWLYEDVEPGPEVQRRYKNFGIDVITMSWGGYYDDSAPGSVVPPFPITSMFDILYLIN